MFNLIITVFPVYFLLLLYFYLNRKSLFSSTDSEREIPLFNLFSLVLFLGILLRIINLNYNSFWIDELFSIDTALKGSVNDVIRECSEDVHPPLYQIILFYYVKFAGSSEMATRLLSAVFGIFSISGFFLIARKLFTPEKAVNMLLMFSVAYLPVFYSQEVRSYSLLLMLTIFTNYFFLNVIINSSESKFKRYSYNTIYVTCSLALLLTHYYGILILIFNAAYLIFYNLLTRNTKDAVKQILKKGILISVTAVIFYLVWGHLILNQYQRDFWPAVPEKNIFSAFVFYVLNPNLKNYFINDIILYVIALLIFISFIYYIFSVIKNRNRIHNNEMFNTLFVIFWLFIPFTLSFIQSVYSNPSISFRNLIILSPAVIIMFYMVSEKSISLILNFFSDKNDLFNNLFKNLKTSFKEYTFILSLLLSVILFTKTYGYYTYASKQDIRGLIKEVSEDSELYYKNPVIFSTSKTASMLNYYFVRFSPVLRIKDYLAGESLQDELIKYKSDIESHDYLVLFDIKKWGKDSEVTIEYFKSKYKLISEKESDNFRYFVFSLKKN